MSAAHDPKGEIVKVPDADERPAGWFESHSWHMLDGAIEKLKKQSETELVFLCGVTTINENKGLFDQTICLDIDEATLRERIARRAQSEDNDFGGSEHELKQILAFHKTATDKYRRQGAQIIDATQQLNKVVDDILSLTKTGTDK